MAYDHDGECPRCGGSLVSDDGEKECCEDCAWPHKLKLSGHCNCGPKDYCDVCADDPLPEDWAGTEVVHQRHGIGTVLGLSNKRTDCGFFLSVRFDNGARTVLRRTLETGDAIAEWRDDHRSEAA